MYLIKAKFPRAEHFFGPFPNSDRAKEYAAQDYFSDATSVTIEPLVVPHVVVSQIVWKRPDGKPEQVFRG